MPDGIDPWSFGLQALILGVPDHSLRVAGKATFITNNLPGFRYLDRLLMFHGCLNVHVKDCSIATSTVSRPDDDRRLFQGKFSV